MNFSMKQLSRWMYHFSISCKEVGFMIYKSRHAICKSFAAYFFLWGNGGPNWHREQALWCLEKEAKWTLVGSKSKKSYADAVHSPPNTSNHNSNSTARKSTFLRLAYPMDYQMNYLSPLPPIRKQVRILPDHRSATKVAYDRQKHVLCWVPKIQISKSLLAQAKSAPASARGPNLSRTPVPPIQSNSVMVKLCSRCLGPGHSRKEFTNLVRCKLCFNYGHISPACLSKPRLQRKFRPIAHLEGEGADSSDKYQDGTPILDSSASIPPPRCPPTANSRKPQFICLNGELGSRPPPIRAQRFHRRASAEPVPAPRGVCDRMLHAVQ